MEANTPTCRYSDDQDTGMHKGGWVETHAITYCGELLEEVRPAVGAKLSLTHANTTGVARVVNLPRFQSVLLGGASAA
eukprot:SAG31_NODE_6195_length_2128_cov_1.620503_1_plen_78_part_00